MPLPRNARAKKKNTRKKTPSADNRTCGQILRSLPKLKPVDRRYIGHHNALCESRTSTTFIDVEMTSIDKDYMDKIKLFIDETQIIQQKRSGKPLNSTTKDIIKKRCERVYEYAEMKIIYDRQVEIDALLDGIKC
jgi:hypothetical protein